MPAVPCAGVAAQRLHAARMALKRPASQAVCALDPVLHLWRVEDRPEGGRRQKRGSWQDERGWGGVRQHLPDMSTAAHCSRHDCTGSGRGCGVVDRVRGRAQLQAGCRLQAKRCALCVRLQALAIPYHEVLGRPQQAALCRQAVSPSPAGLLVVGLQGRRNALRSAHTTQAS